ncbi:MAG: manganese efflux pump [Clostridia bacterium]|nr:manganese efflux pump [Clostridia bacterium]
MQLWELLLIAVGLSMDAFAVAVCKGLNMRRLSISQMLLIALFFGGFQALMPLVGWFVGSQFASFIEGFDHWVAFGLLAFLGGKMLFEAIKGDDEDECCSCQGEKVKLSELTLLAVATSIDALAVGITFALLPDTNITLSVILIGVVTFVLSAVGVIIGNKCSARFEKKAEIAGGAILILLGVKILLEHLEILVF